MKKTFDISQAKTGDILICQGKSSTSKVIKKMTDSKDSHTAVFLFVNGQLCVFDAQIEGCYPMELDSWLKKFDYKVDVYRRKIPINEQYFSDNCVNYFGVKYDLKHLGVGLVLSKMGFKDMANKYRKNGRFICSELTAHLMLIPNHEDFAPKNIREYVDKKGEHYFLGCLNN